MGFDGLGEVNICIAAGWDSQHAQLYAMHDILELQGGILHPTALQHSGSQGQATTP